MNKRNLKQLEELPSVSSDTKSITPISSIISTLTLWTIEALIIFKSPLKNWNKGQSKGDVINFDVKDDSGQIRIVAFNELAKEMDSNFNLNDCIELSQGIIKKRNNQWIPDTHEFYIQISRYSTCRKIEKGLKNFKFFPYLSTIEEIHQTEEGKFVNLFCLVVKCKEIEKISTKVTGKELLKRELMLLD